MITLTVPTSTPVSFPYGTFPVDPQLRARYEQDYSCASSYSLPHRLPHHHPVLTRLEGTTPLAYALPPWWPACVAQVRSEALRPLLATLSAQEFRAGCLESSRWKAFRESLAEEERRRLPASPKLAALLEDTTWFPHFQERGSADTPDQFSLVISTRPLDFLYMSNGREWRSCQHYQNGRENYRLPGNFYDTGIALALLLAPGTAISDEKAVLARTTLRVLSLDGQPVVAIGRTYHNHETLALLLLGQLARLLDAQYLAWGWINGVNSLEWCQDGCLGAALRQRLEKERDADGERCWFPADWFVPYVDGAHTWDTDEEHLSDDSRCMQLHVTLQRMRPRALPVPSSQTLQAITRLGTAEMLPRVD